MHHLKPKLTLTSSNTGANKDVTMISRMYYRAYLSSGAYTISAANAEDAAYEALSLSKDDDYLIDIEPIYDLKETVLPEQLAEVEGCT